MSYIPGIWIWLGIITCIALSALFAGLNLAIFNLLPIPILDGGVILLLVMEMFMRRDLSLRVKEAVFKVGFVFLMLLSQFSLAGLRRIAMPLFIASIVMLALLNDGAILSRGAAGDAGIGPNLDKENLDRRRGRWGNR